MKPNSVVITAILCLCIIQVAAMQYGIDGVFRAMIAAAIAGLAGWRIKI